MSDISRTKNQDIIDGEYRPINLKASPFKQKGKEVFRYTCPTGELKSIFFIKGTSQSNNL